MKVRKQRQFRETRGGKKTAGSITLYHQRIPREKFDALSEEQRYCFLLLGHIHDEISWLQRMSYVASRSGSSGGELHSAGNMMQVTFLVRLLLGKLFEFQKLLAPEQSPIRKFIGEYFSPDNKTGGEERLAKVLAMYETEDWLKIARNKHFLHYPTLGDVRDTLNDPNIVWEVAIAHGKQSSNTFYPASSVMANYSWFRLVNPVEPMKGLEAALDATRKLSSMTLETLEQSIGFFVDTALVSLSENEEVEMLVSESIHEMKLNYFVKT